MESFLYSEKLGSNTLMKNIFFLSRLLQNIYISDELIFIDSSPDTFMYKREEKITNKQEPENRNGLSKSKKK